ncbi:MAG: oligosaccharide flippase family protein [Desulfocapsa sp.]|uniref:Oligosaccharide flippase family protein n=1 Tax=Desulfotalea psychrophila TaxID=84980 RepID=A0ABS3AYJ5_9BACT|nr:oligosaccharide flippase family protein [Desulfocapsa sp.]MBN4068395.1 oligosaccharide flippase family protein [Desulfotalea psychrophila]
MPSVSHKLLSGATLRVIGFTIQILIAFFLSPYIIHTLGDRMYGFWVLIGTFIGYYGLLDFGLSTAVNRHIAGALGAKDDNTIRKVYSTAMPIFFGIGCIALLITVIIVIVSPWILTDPEEIPLFRAVILILGFNMAIDFLARVYIGTLQAQMNFHIVSFVQIAASLVRATLIVMALTAGYKILALAWISFFTTLASNMVYYYYARKKLPTLIFDIKSFSRSTATTLFSYSFFMMISQVANMLRFQVDVFVIASFLSLSAVTHYSIASTLVNYFNQLLGTIMSVFNPLFSQQEAAKEHEEIKETLFFATRISVAISSFVGFGMVAWGSPFIERWMGLEYQDAYPCLVVLVLGVLTFLWQTPAHSYIYATSKHKFLAVLNIIEGISNLLLSLVLVRYYGIFGVALGTFFSLSVSKLIVFPIYFAKVSSFLYAEYMKQLLLYVIKCGVALVVPFVITSFWIAADYAHLILVGLLSALFYALFSWVILLSKADRKILISAFLSVLNKV